MFVWRGGRRLFESVWVVLGRRGGVVVFITRVMMVMAMGRRWMRMRWRSTLMRWRCRR